VARTADSERVFSDAVTVEGVFYALPVLLFLGTVVWALVSDDSWWARVIAPFVMFGVGLFASLALVLAGVVLEQYAPFWRRSFWGRSR
jgi:hypothetical protein